MNKKEIADYIQLRCSGRNQSPHFTLNDFWKEMVELHNKLHKEIQQELETK
jgi:hypothetical protein